MAVVTDAPVLAAASMVRGADAPGIGTASSVPGTDAPGIAAARVVPRAGAPAVTTGPGVPGTDPPAVVTTPMARSALATGVAANRPLRTVDLLQPQVPGLARLSGGSEEIVRDRRPDGGSAELNTRGSVGTGHAARIRRASKIATPTRKETPTAMTTPTNLERRRHIRGLLLLAIAAILFAILRAGLHNVFTHDWWRVW